MVLCLAHVLTMKQRASPCTFVSISVTNSPPFPPLAAALPPPPPLPRLRGSKREDRTRGSPSALPVAAACAPPPPPALPSHAPPPCSQAEALGFLDRHAGHWPLVTACVGAAFYPQVAFPHAGGWRTLDRTHAAVQRDSVLVGRAPTDFLVYHDRMVHNTRISLQEASLVGPLPLLLGCMALQVRGGRVARAGPGAWQGRRGDPVPSGTRILRRAVWEMIVEEERELYCFDPSTPPPPFFSGMAVPRPKTQSLLTLRGFLEGRSQFLLFDIEP